MYGHPLLSRTAIAATSVGGSEAPIAVCALRVRAGEERVRIFPAGQFDAPRGALAGSGPWFIDAELAARLAAQVAALSTDIVIDYEHQTLLSEKNGQEAPAAGWILRDSLAWEPDRAEPGLYATVRWTKKAAAYIDADEYRYLSPVFPYGPTGAVLGLEHVALTNSPAINSEHYDTLRAAASARRSFPAHGGAAPEMSQETPEMDLLKQLLAALGLPDTTTEADALKGVAALKARADQVQAVRKALEAEEGANLPEVVAALKSKAVAKPDLSGYVPKAMYDETREQLAALKANSDSAEIDRLIEAGLADGRIAGQATADYLREQGIAALKAHLNDAPSVAALKGTQTNGKQPEGEDGKGDKLTAEELAVCKTMGLTPEQFRAARD